MAAAMEARSLKQALIESLSAILSSDQQARQMAEEQLKLLEVTEGNKCLLVSRYPAAGKCFQKTRYPAVRNFDQFSRNGSFNSSKNIRYLFRNVKRL